MSSTCPVCGAPGGRRFGSKDGFDADRCPRCGHVHVLRRPTPEEIDALYRSYSYADEVGVPAFVRDLLDEVVRSFEPARERGRLLDVGFGDGVLLESAAAAGWDALGIEVSGAAVASGRGRGLPVAEADFLSSDVGDGYDVVVMTEVLEHVPEPARFLERARAVLRPGGLLYATTPHGRGVSGRLLRGRWSVYSPPEHLHLFSIRSLRRELERAGFRRTSVTTSGIGVSELVAAVRRPAGVAAGYDRVGADYRVNERLVTSPSGATVKRAANALLRATRLGDGLRVRAWR